MFDNIRVENTNGYWRVIWKDTGFNTASKDDADGLAELIKFAYRAGRQDMINNMRGHLGLPELEGYE